MTPRAVLFDWDGTLVDSAEVTFRCYENVFASYGIGFTRDDYERGYSPNGYDTYTRMGLPRQHWTDADTRWRASYAAEHSPLMPGARALLERLHAAGLRLGIVTAGDADRVRGELETHALAGFFAATVFGADAAHKKPHPAPLLLGLDRLSADRASTVYVGDSPEDVAMARAAGVWTIGIPGGFPNRAALLAARPDQLASSLREVADLLLPA